MGRCMSWCMGGGGCGVGGDVDDVIGGGKNAWVYCLDWWGWDLSIGGGLVGDGEEVFGVVS